MARTGGLLAKVRTEWAVYVLGIARALTIGAAYIAVRGIPGLTSSFVAIFVALLAFDVMVAAPSLRLGHVDLHALFSRTLSALTQTIASLGKGLSLGLLFGVLSLAGLSPTVGSIFTAGLGYTWANRARGSFTAFVAVLGGLAIFEQISAIQDANTYLLIFTHVAPVAWRVTFGTVVALLSGWFFGIPFGFLTRLLLGRSYRMRGSNAYDPPLEVRPFEEVVRVGRDFRLTKLRVEPDSLLVGRRIADLGWRDEFKAAIVVIERGDEYVSMPGGNDIIQAEDVLVVLCPSAELDKFAWLAKSVAKGV